MWSNSWSKYISETSKLCVILRINCFALGFSMHRKHTVNIHEYTYVFSQRFLHFSFERWDDVLLFHAEDFFCFRVVMIQPCLVRGHYAVEEVFFMWIPPQKCLRKLNSSISSFSVSNLGIQRAATILIFRWSLRIVKIVPELTLNISASSETVTRPSFSIKSNIESLPQENLSMPFINKSTTHFWQISASPSILTVSVGDFRRATQNLINVPRFPVTSFFSPSFETTTCLLSLISPEWNYKLRQNFADKMT